MRRREAPFYPGLAVLSGLVLLLHVANGCGLLGELHGLLWRRFALAVELCLPAVLLCTGLRIARSRLKELFINTFVSQQALVWSVTVIVIGLYLLTVGVIGECLHRMNQPLGPEFSVVVVFGALVAPAVLVLARNFYRSKYDCRAEWLRVTESFQSSTTKDAILNCLLDLPAKTFSTTTIAIWVFRTRTDAIGRPGRLLLRRRQWSSPIW